MISESIFLRWKLGKQCAAESKPERARETEEVIAGAESFARLGECDLLWEWLLGTDAGGGWYILRGDSSASLFWLLLLFKWNEKVRGEGVLKRCELLLWEWKSSLPREIGLWAALRTTPLTPLRAPALNLKWILRNKEPPWMMKNTASGSYQ